MAKRNNYNNTLCKSTKDLCLQIESIYNHVEKNEIDEKIESRFKALIDFINLLEYAEAEVHPYDFIEFLITRSYEEQNYHFLALVKSHTLINIPDFECFTDHIV